MGVRSISASEASENVLLPTLSSCSSSPLLLPAADASPAHAPPRLSLSAKASGSLSLSHSPSPSSGRGEATTDGVKLHASPPRLPSSAQLHGFYAVCQVGREGACAV